MMYKACNIVKPDTIKNSFSHAGFSFITPEVELVGSQTDNNEFFDVLRDQGEVPV